MTLGLFSRGAGFAEDTPGSLWWDFKDGLSEAPEFVHHDAGDLGFYHKETEVALHYLSDETGIEPRVIKLAQAGRRTYHRLGIDEDLVAAPIWTQIVLLTIEEGRPDKVSYKRSVLGDVKLQRGDFSGIQGATFDFPKVEEAVLELARSFVYRSGYRFDCPDVSFETVKPLLIRELWTE